ncbi:MAG: DUF1800 family protein [Robiginitomaculum sp.]|nr:DUF1800 family protein [Robiginitomaculum sp.]
MVDLDAYIAAHKFGLGARFDETINIGASPQAWLQAQLTDVSSTLEEYNLPSSQAGIELFYHYLETQRAENAADQPIAAASVNVKQQMGGFFQSYERMTAEQVLYEDLGVRGSNIANATNVYLKKSQNNISLPASNKTSQELAEDIFAMYYAEIGVRTVHAILTPASFREALVRFWSDHFSVYSQKSLQLLVTAGAMEREAIRPNVTGKFVDLLIAAETHPAMLMYLDNWISIGPNSYAGQNFGYGLNENLAREIMELHTLGVNGGYEQEDIVSFAKAITGWTIGNPNIQPEQLGNFIFEPLFHEPGSVNVMNKEYLGTGQDQGLEILADFASNAATAGFIAGKLARHFHSDNPPQSLIDRLELAFISSGGDLGVVSATLVTSPEMWDGTFAKLRNSEEFVIATLRAFGVDTLTPGQLVFVFDAVGQVPFGYHAPDGWPKEESSWASSSISSAKINYSELLASFVAGQPEPSTMATNILGSMLSASSADGISNAVNVEQGYTLMMMSPEFQRR